MSEEKNESPEELGAPEADVSADDAVESTGEGGALAAVDSSKEGGEVAKAQASADAPVARRVPKVEVSDTPLKVAPGFQDDHDRLMHDPTTDDTNVMLWGFLVVFGGGIMFVMVYILQVALAIPAMTAGSSAAIICVKACR